MRSVRKLFMGFAAVALATGAIALFGMTSASAAKAPPVNATGTVTCTQAVGLAKFSTPLTATGPTTGSDNVTVKVNLAGCSASVGSNVTTSNFTGKVKGTLTTNGGTNCSNLSGEIPVSASNLTIKWTGKDGTAKLLTSSLSLTQLDGEAVGSNGNPGFAFGSQAQSATASGTVTGSFPSSTASGELDVNQGAAQLLGFCQGKHGLKKVNIQSGSTTL